MKMIVNSFRIERCTVGHAMEENCTLISENVGLSFIVFLSKKNDVLDKTSCFLQSFGFLQVIGCVNGTHIPIKQLSENTHNYFSYKLCYTLNWRAICDGYGKFINVEKNGWEAYTMLLYSQVAKYKKASRQVIWTFWIRN